MIPYFIKNFGSFAILLSSFFLPSQKIYAEPLKLVIDQIPISLNPRQTTDAIGQRIGALIYRSLTSVSENLKTTPDLAQSWVSRKNNLVWIFKLRAGQIDHSGQAITPTLIQQCILEYFNPKKKALISSQFEDILSISLKDSDRLWIELKRPDPFFPKNISLIRYFKTKSNQAPCVDPKDENDIITSGPLKIVSPWNQINTQICFQPVDPLFRSGCLKFISDENTRVLALLKGDVNAAPSSLALSKTHWIQKKREGKFVIKEGEGINVSYLGFKLTDPILKNINVRRAISQSIDVKSIVQHKMFGFCKLATSFLHPIISGIVPPELPKLDVAQAKIVLDLAGYKTQSDGFRFRLKYLTTPSKEGTELALMIKDQLRVVQIAVDLFTVDPSVFIKTLSDGKYQLYSNRWIGVSDASIFKRALGTGQSGNRVLYSDPITDHWISQLYLSKNEDKIKYWTEKLQNKMNADLPYLPLFYWNNVFIYNSSFSHLFRGIQLSASGALAPYFKEPHL